MIISFYVVSSLGHIKEDEFCYVIFIKYLKSSDA